MHYIELSNLWVGKAQGVHARMRIAHYRVMYNSAFFVCVRFSFASGTEAS